MLVSPMAPVLCALSCPNPDAMTRGVSDHDARAAEPQSSGPCHEDAAAAPQHQVAQASAEPGDVLWQPCQHPAAVTPPAQPAAPRVPQPLAATTVARYVFAPIHFARSAPVSSPAPTQTSRHVAGFSLALRI